MLAILAAFFLSLTSPVTPALHTPFVVTDNGGALVTRQPLAVGQVIYSGGIAYTVQLVHGTGIEEITLTPRLPAKDIGKTVPFST